jgi:hypothetical protein
MMVGVANRYQRNRREPTPAGTTDQCLADLPENVCPNAARPALGNWVTARRPRDLDAVMKRAGAQWEPGTRRWLIEQRRIGPVIPLERATDPLFRQAGMSLDRRVRGVPVIACPSPHRRDGTLRSRPG